MSLSRSAIRGDAPRLREHRLGRRAARQPAIRFLLLDRLRLIIGARRHGPPPHFAMRQAEHRATARVQYQDRMQQKPAARAECHRPKPAPPARQAPEAQLARVLDRHHVQAGHPFGEARRLRGEDRLDRHILIAEKPAEPHFVAAPIRQTAQHARACVHQAAQQQSPLFASRSSPNRPAPQPPTSPAIAAPLPSLDRCRRNHSRFLTRKQIRPSPRTNVCIPKREAGEGLAGVGSQAPEHREICESDASKGKREGVGSND